MERAIGDANTPTLVTENNFDTGLTHRVLRGSVLTSKQRDEQGYIFSRTTNAYTTTTLATATGGRSVEYAYKSSERVEHIEGTDASAARVTLTEWQQDEYGDVVKESNWGEVAGAEKLAGNDEVVTIRTFANNTEDWILGRLASEEVQDAAGSRVASRRIYYDGAAFQGLTLGEVARGDVRRVESWIEGDRWSDEAAFDHDEHGNVTVAIDARGGRSEYDYDLESQAFVVAERRFSDAQSHLNWAGEYDERFGVVTSLVDANGQKTLLGYDALGRITAVARPGDTLDKPTVSYPYTLGAPLSNVKTEQRTKANFLKRTGETARPQPIARPRGLSAPSVRLILRPVPEKQRLFGPAGHKSALCPRRLFAPLRLRALGLTTEQRRRGFHPPQARDGAAPPGRMNPNGIEVCASRVGRDSEEVSRAYGMGLPPGGVR
jgi:YD repeat-containing protein